MKKIALGQTISILANLGVIAGIAFLAFEIRESNVQARVATLLEDASMWQEWSYELGSDAEYADLYYRGLENFGELDPVEQLRFDLLMRSFFYRLESGVEAFAELGTPIGLTKRRGYVEALFLRDGFREWWTYTDRGTLPRPVVVYLEELDPESR
jgi:hypothetical protein